MLKTVFYYDFDPSLHMNIGNNLSMIPLQDALDRNNLLSILDKVVDVIMIFTLRERIVR